MTHRPVSFNLLPRAHIRGHVLFRADIAQLVEQRIRNAKVVGSTPIIGTISNSSQVYRNQLKARILRFLARILSPVINWTQPESSYSWGHKWGLSVFGPVEMPPMKLNARQVDAAKPREKAYKLADGAGLYLEVVPSGSRYWRIVVAY